MSKQKRQNKVIRGVAGLLSVLGTILILMVIALSAILVVPEVKGYRTYHVVTGSMAPAIPAGSLIYVDDVVAEEVQEYEVIAYYSSLENGGVVTHRVVRNDFVNGNFITKGDANEKEDPTPVPYDNLIGKVVFEIPGLGNILTAMTTTYGKILVACMVGVGAIFNMLGNYIRDKKS